MLPRKRNCGAAVEGDSVVREEVLKKPKGEGYVISSSSVEVATENNHKPPKVMDYEVANGTKQVDIDEDLHSRQLAVYGRETMRRLFASSVLVSGLQGLGVEIAKNLVLAGVKSITLHDDGKVELWDLSSNFYFSEDDVGKNRAIACIQKLQELNDAVIISAVNGALSQEQLSDFQDVKHKAGRCLASEKLHDLSNISRHFVSLSMVPCIL